MDNDNSVVMKEKTKILIADDVEIIAKTIKNILIEDDRLEVVEIVNNGTEEYEKIIDLGPDLVITDNQMPELDGIDVIEKIYNADIQDKPTFIMLTADAFNLELVNKAKELNVFKIIKKPIQDEILKETIEEFIIEKNNEKQVEKNNNAMIEMKDIEKRKSFWKRILKFFGIIKNTD